MTEAGALAAGRVSATPDRPPPRSAYDIVVLGGGLLGAVVAERLRALVPERSLLLVEADGLPNEGGATVASPGLLLPSGTQADGAGVGVVPPAAVRAGEEAADADPGRAAPLAWARAWAVAALTGGGGGSPRPGERAGWLELAALEDAAPAGSAALRSWLPAGSVRAVAALTGVAPDHPAVLRDGGWLSTEALALTLARSAVRAGADLALNARARPGSPERIVLERLAVDRRMRVAVHARQPVTAGTVIVACGAAGAAVAESALDRPVGLASAYLQFPRVRLDRGLAATALPVVSLAGWRWRPGSGGALLVPPPLPPDPEGYRPVGGRLLGVPVGLRRELLDRLLAVRELEPLLASGRLELGKSVRGVRGGWFSVPSDGRPSVRELSAGWWLVAGGTLGVEHDVAAAAGLAATIAGAPAW